MRIFILNWRDIRSPRAGGAERVTHEVARRLVARGHDVTWLSSASSGLPADETVDGVNVLRRGSEATTRLHAPAAVRRAAPDVILEEINTLPYFAPLWADAPVVLYMNQLAREVWWYEAAKPVALAGWLAEPIYLRAYRDCEAVTISRSSLDDLRRLGLNRRILVVPMAAEHESLSDFPAKPLSGQMVAIGRLTPSKRYDHAIRALASLRTTHPDASLTLIGDGRDNERLRKLAAAEGLDSDVHFAGRVSDTEKHELIDGADVLVGTSVREGWGLTVTEAAARGTPSVVYDIPGFRDAVIDRRTGRVVNPTPEDLAEGVRWLIEDPARYELVRASAAEVADTPGFDAAADGFEEILQANVRTDR
jgi:glycosyltransferase involved in cell wall biosynthesis